MFHRLTRAVYHHPHGFLELSYDRRVQTLRRYACCYGRAHLFDRGSGITRTGKDLPLRNNWCGSAVFPGDGIVRER